jgi:TRAP-type C4-dicarboxylate transport system substrate-binding protein
MDKPEVFMNLRKFSFLAAILLLILSGCSKKEAAPTAEGAKFTVRASTVQMPNQQMGRGLETLEKEITKRFGDRATVKLFQSAQLYSGAEEIEALGRGEIDIAMVVGGTAETVSPKLALIKLPFMFKNYTEAYDFYDSPGGAEMMQPVYDRGIKLAGIFASGAPLFANSKRVLKMPADFSGLKMRAPGRMDSMSAEALGAMGMVTPSEETYSAIQQGVIDGMLTPNTVFHDRRYYEIQKYVTDAGLFSFGCGYTLVNQKFFDSLSAADQSLLNEAFKATEKIMRDEMDTLDSQIIQTIKDKGCEVYKLNNAEQEAWREATLKVYPAMEPSIGADLIKKAQDFVAAARK